MTPDQVTACLVTRGDVDMVPIIDSLIFRNVVVWNNAEREDWKCAGRYKAAELAPTDVVYFQDDDVIVPRSTQRALVRAYKAGVMVANWGHGENPDGYEDLPLVCGGAIVDVGLPLDAMWFYEQHHALDEDFMYEADFVVGVLYERFEHLHLPFNINMDIAQHPSRLCNQPWQRDLKLAMTNRAREIRDQVAA